jgi:cytochrome c553
VAAPPPLKGPQPSFAAGQRHDAPPLSGGTLLLTKDKERLVAADPDRDVVYVVTLANRDVVTIPLTAHDEPGRLTEDAAGRVHVALRRGGAVVTIDPNGGKQLARRSACPAPRGVAADDARSRILVACEGGELVALPQDPTLEPATATTILRHAARDLRDVYVSGDRIYVSRFRTAEVLSFSATAQAPTPDVVRVADDFRGAPTLAWRMLPADDGTPTISHQIAATNPVTVSQPSGYGTPTSDPTDCGGDGIVFSALSHVGGGAMPSVIPKHAVLPIDFAIDGDRIAIVAAGNAHTRELPQVFVVEGMTSACNPVPVTYAVSGQATSIVRLAAGRFAILSREPAQIEIFPGGGAIALGDGSSVEDTGHAIFHANSGSGLACASCHGEAGDDGHVWTFDTVGARRTPSLRGTLAGTAPYHWNGEESDIAALASDVLTKRMSGPELSPSLAGSLRDWLFALPAPAPSSIVDAAAAARGKAIYERADVKCASCHGGPMLTSSATIDVGSGGAFQVPSLVGLGLRAPFLHDGCASTLEERFTVCGSPTHGDTSKLGTSDVADLVAYLKTL